MPRVQREEKNAKKTRKQEKLLSVLYVIEEMMKRETGYAVICVIHGITQNVSTSLKVNIFS